MLVDAGNLWPKSPLDKRSGSNNKMPERQLEKDKQHGNEETYTSQRGIKGRIRALNDNTLRENQG
jgi:hypothetical protein